MKTIETQLLSYDELSPEAQAKVIDAKIAQAVEWDPLEHVYPEVNDSLKAVIDAIPGIQLTDYSYGAYNQNNKIKVSGSNEDESGGRALVILRRALIKNGYPKDLSFPGICGFTGVCYDDDICESLVKNLRAGESFRDAFNSLADDLGNMLEKEYEYLTSKEVILELLDTKEEIYTAEGNEF